MENLMYFLPLSGLAAILYVMWKSSWVSKQDAGNEKMKRIADHISSGAMAFLKAEYKVLAIFVFAISILLIFKGMSEENSSPLVALSFITGALCSGLAGFLGNGLLNLRDISTKERWHRVDIAFNTGYKNKLSQNSWAKTQWQFFHDKGAIPITFLGVWDTVGALGIPDDLEIINLFDRKETWQWSC